MNSSSGDLNRIEQLSDEIAVALTLDALMGGVVLDWDSVKWAAETILVSLKETFGLAVRDAAHGADELGTAMKALTFVTATAVGLQKAAIENKRATVDMFTTGL